MDVRVSSGLPYIVDSATNMDIDDVSTDYPYYYNFKPSCWLITSVYKPMLLWTVTLEVLEVMVAMDITKISTHWTT